MSELTVLDTKALTESVKIIFAALNKGCKAGAYTIDEAALLNVAVKNIDRAVDTLDEYQKFHIKQNENSNDK